MTNLTNTERLALLNTYRAADGKAPFADWRAGRHQPMLDTYLIKDTSLVDNMYPHVATFEAFEATANELAQQEGRPSTELEPGTYEVQVTDVVIEDGKAAIIATVEGTDTEVKLPVAEEVKTEKAPSYKDFANYDRSRIMKPVEFVHSFLDAHPDLSRKAAVQALVEGGVNYSTARTQYQRWFAKRKG